MEQLVKVINVLMFFYVATSYAQDTIHWDKQRPLAWEDFRGIPEDNAIESAQAATGVALAFQYREDLENNKPVANCKFPLPPNRSIRNSCGFNQTNSNNYGD